MLTLTRPEGPEPADFHLSRRLLMGGVMFAGYAAYALGADADPIHTDAAGLVTETVQLSSGIPAYVARPDKGGRWPVVLVVSEVFGLHEYIRDVCRRFAKLGYAAIAPAFFVRVGDPAPLTDFDAIRKIVFAASDKQVMDDIAATLAVLRGSSWAETSRIAITGFCWGGRIVWLACETFPDFKAGVAWYGQLAPVAGQAADPTREMPIDLVAQLHAPVLGLYAGKDPLSQAVPAMRAALEKAGKSGDEIIIYEDAGHGFHADYRPSYNAADAADGWSRLLAHFALNGVPPRRGR
ncbi:MAG TPA: dienelactone hydrolase family protein [Caulobacteraceae bacterium]|nr:dienelactone hydrolase family protein [Caulobacteraceae bacterium]